MPKQLGPEPGQTLAGTLPPASGTAVDCGVDSDAGGQAPPSGSESWRTSGRGAVMSSSVSLSPVLIDRWVVIRLISC